MSTIKAIDAISVHKIASSQVATDLQTCVKEMVENSLDAGATSIEVRFKEFGLEVVEVVDNGSGIPPANYEAVALRHHTSKIESFEDVSMVSTFGFRGEALSSLCALSESVLVTTATAPEAPKGTILEFDKKGKLINSSGKVARQRGTTVTITKLFMPLPVRRKEFERNVKREFGKALGLLYAYALLPCATVNNGVRLTCVNQVNGKKTPQFRTDGTQSSRSSVSALWGPKALENIVDLDLRFEVETEKSVMRRQALLEKEVRHSIQVQVRGLISKFAVSKGRTSTDRQFFFINGRPCTPTKVQKAFNEVYRTFNANQSPFIVADFIVPTDSLDINISPDKRTIFIHSENNLIQALKAALENKFSSSRSTYDLNGTQTELAASAPKPKPPQEEPLFIDDGDEEGPSGDSTPQQESPKSPGKPMFGEPMLLANAETDTGTTDHTPERSRAPTSSRPSNGLEEPAATNGDCPIEDITPSDETPEPGTADNSMQVDFTSSPTASQMQAIAMRSPRQEAASPVTASGSRLAPPRTSQPAATATVSPLKRSMSSLHEDHPVQLILSTQDAAWNLRKALEEPADHPAKRHKPNSRSSTGSRKGSSSKSGQTLRKQLVSFARSGSQPPLLESGGGASESSDSEAEIDELEDCSSTIGGEEIGAHDTTPGPTADLEDDNITSSGSRAAREAGDDTMPICAGTVATDLDQGTKTSRSSPESHLPESSQSTGVSVTSSSSSTTRRPVEFIRTASATNDGATLRMDMAELTSSWQRLGMRLAELRALGAESFESAQTSDDQMALTRDAGLTNTEDDGKASEVLSRVLKKADFLAMELVGQFNKGFIITRLRKYPESGGDSGGEEDGPVAHSGAPVMDDLFIVDQHAADEKYNFERLQETTKISSQRLYQPMPLELTAADELVALENMDVLQQNGFEVSVDESGTSDGRRQLNLVAQPISKNTVFDVKDLEELIHLMRDQPQGKMVRCSKTRSMFAMRACRSSVMVGTALKAQQMLSVVRNMGTMNQPWHCPHGRPTMRHLSDIMGMGSNLDAIGRMGRRSVDFSALS